jgi:dTDP-4-amino-4,6-dideoxygalactose transaminase
VLVPAYTWISTAAAPVLLGAIPVLVEIDATLTMDPADLESKITPRTRAVVPVHMLNLPADMDRIMDIARRHGLLVVEDACQAVGVTYRSRHLGSIGDAGAFSFNQHKNIRAGEGGAVLVDDERTYVRAAMLHDVGAYTRGRLTHDELPFVGMNLRMPEVSSAVVRPQLRRLHKRMARQAERREIMLDALATRSDVSVSPHNDPSAAVGLTVCFDDPEAARHFASARGVNRLIDTGRHVYPNWQPILGRRCYDERVSPWNGHDIDYVDSYTATTAILERTCSVSLDPDVPLPVMRRVAKAMAPAPSRMSNRDERPAAG